MFESFFYYIYLMKVNMSLLNVLSGMRRDYKKGNFNENLAADNPFRQFEIWFQDVLDAKILEPTAMTVATCSKDAKPSLRVVLLKKADDKGFVFYSNYESHKGKELEENPNAAILFHWDFLERQIRIEGKVEKVSKEESEEYYKSRPYESRIGAWASKQSQVLSSRMSLMKDVALLMAKYPKEVPLPPFWGGYRLIPDYFEFWQGRESRLHDRICYKLKNNSWTKYRIYP